MQSLRNYQLAAKHKSPDVTRIDYPSEVVEFTGGIILKIDLIDYQFLNGVILRYNCKWLQLDKNVKSWKLHTTWTILNTAGLDFDEVVTHVDYMQ